MNFFQVAELVEVW